MAMSGFATLRGANPASPANPRRAHVWPEPSHSRYEFCDLCGLMTEMKVLTAEDEIIGGVDAWIHLARTVWWMYPVFVLGRLKWFYHWMDRFYRAFAARRYCLGGSCRIGGD